MIATTHIVGMLEAAAQLSTLCHGQPDDERLLPAVDGIEHLLPARPHGATTWMALERAANLAEHAAAELRDEAERARGHWPVV